MSHLKEEGGFVNNLINKLPIELHLPGYQYCGPGTKLKRRLARGDSGINQLDEACKNHDIAYSQNKDLNARHEADKVLQDKAWSRVKASDASLGEKAAAWTVTNIMKVKRKLGMGLKQKPNVKRKLRTRIKQKPFGKTVFNKAKNEIKRHKVIDLKEGVKVSLKAARASIKEAGGRKRIRTPRIIPIPKTGGLLPLIPLFAGLSALGSLAGGAAGIANAANKARNAQKQLVEAQKHNKTMEAIALGKKGDGLYMRPYKRGMGLFIKPSKNY